MSRAVHFIAVRMNPGRGLPQMPLQVRLHLRLRLGDEPQAHRVRVEEAGAAATSPAWFTRMRLAALAFSASLRAAWAPGPPGWGRDEWGGAVKTLIALEISDRIRSVGLRFLDSLMVLYKVHGPDRRCRRCRTGQGGLASVHFRAFRPRRRVRLLRVFTNVHGIFQA